MEKPVLWYIADPMCSWCWGFAPVIEKIRQEYSTSFTVKVMPGGLRPGTDTPLLSEKRAQILHHWHSVHATTGQPFTFEHAMPEGFIYDTEPACRAVISVSLIEPDKVFPFLVAIQQAFYFGQEDITQLVVLKKFAANLDMTEAVFTTVFQSDETKRLTQTGFQRVAQWGVSGFPTLLIEEGTSRHLVTSGYCPFDVLCQSLDVWLRQHGLD